MASDRDAAILRAAVTAMVIILIILVLVAMATPLLHGPHKHCRTYRAQVCARQPTKSTMKARQRFEVITWDERSN